MPGFSGLSPGWGGANGGERSHPSMIEAGARVEDFASRPPSKRTTCGRHGVPKMREHVSRPGVLRGLRRHVGARPSSASGTSPRVRRSASGRADSATSWCCVAMDGRIPRTLSETRGGPPRGGRPHDHDPPAQHPGGRGRLRPQSSRVRDRAFLCHQSFAGGRGASCRRTNDASGGPTKWAG